MWGSEAQGDPDRPAVDRAPRVGIVSQSSIPDDPRVRRQGDAFRAAGWEVVGIGLAGAKAAAPSWPILTPDNVAALAEKPAMPETGYETTGWRSAALRLLPLLGRFDLSEYEQRLLSVRLDPRRAETVYWTLNSTFWDLLALGRSRRVDLWLGNDWTSLPIIARLAREQGVSYVYDTHEFAADEFNESGRWRFVQRPIRVATEGRFIRDAAVVSTVSPGIAERLQSLYRLPATPLTIRSTPAYQPMSFRPTGERIRVLYHGAVWQHRGLEACIRSVAAWRPDFDFTIRGPISESYRAELEREIDAAGVRGRVTLAPPVPMIDLVREASAFDVGLFALPGHSQHNQYALPNKFFEYTMAGLALCVSDLPEMSRLVRRFELGRMIDAVEPDVIARAVNDLDRSAIDACKRNALAAARELNWERESERMIEAYRPLLSSGARRS